MLSQVAVIPVVVPAVVIERIRRAKEERIQRLVLLIGLVRYQLRPLVIDCMQPLFNWCLN